MGAKIRPANFKGKKGRSGRKTIAEEVRYVKDKITSEALIELANNKVYKQLDALSGFKDTQAMALPITLKGIVEKKEITGTFSLKELFAKSKDEPGGHKDISTISEKPDILHSRDLASQTPTSQE